MGNKGAVILAAGYSSRMNAFKPLLDVGGLPALERVLLALRGGGISDIVVVTGYERERLLPLIRSYRTVEAHNEEYGKGMHSSVKAGVRKLKETAVRDLDGFLLTPVDYAALGPETVRMIAFNENTAERLIVPCYHGKKGHPLWIPAALIDEIQSNDSPYGLKGVTEKREDEIIRLETGSESVVLDMDTEDEYRDLLAYVGNDRREEDLLALAKGRRFILVRHGQIMQHEKKIFLGQSDIPLSERGRGQAGEAALKLSGMALKTKTIYSSDLARARETAEIISKALNIKEVVPLPGLREMSLGRWDGEYIDDIKEKFPVEFEKRGKNLLSYKYGHGSENFYDLSYRAVKTLEKILKGDGSGDIVAVTHSGVIRALSAALKGEALDEGALNLKIEEGSVHVLSFLG